jgi:hypothetical protein
VRKRVFFVLTGAAGSRRNLGVETWPYLASAELFI